MLNEQKKKGVAVLFIGEDLDVLKRGDWKTCWFIFAGYALVVAVAFAVLFRPKKEQK